MIPEVAGSRPVIHPTCGYLGSIDTHEEDVSNATGSCATFAKALNVSGSIETYVIDRSEPSVGQSRTTTPFLPTDLSKLPRKFVMSRIPLPFHVFISTAATFAISAMPMPHAPRFPRITRCSHNGSVPLAEPNRSDANLSSLSPIATLVGCQAGSVWVNSNGCARF